MINLAIETLCRIQRKLHLLHHKQSHCAHWCFAGTFQWSHHSSLGIVVFRALSDRTDVSSIESSASDTVDRNAFAFHCSTPLFSLAGDFHITATLALVKNLWWWFLNERMCDLEVQQSAS